MLKNLVFAVLTLVSTLAMGQPLTTLGAIPRSGVVYDSRWAQSSDSWGETLVVSHAGIRPTAFRGADVDWKLHRSSIVKVVCYDSQGYGQGTGGVIYSDADTTLVITNSHVVKAGKRGGNRVVVATAYGNCDAQVLWDNPNHSRDGVDLALLSIKSPVEMWAIPIEQSNNRTGLVYSAGYPRDAFRLVSRRGSFTPATFTDGTIQATTPVLQGESGSPLVNDAGELVGVVFANDEVNGNPSRHAFAVPASAVVRVIETCCRSGPLARIAQRIFSRRAQCFGGTCPKPQPQYRDVYPGPQQQQQQQQGPMVEQSPLPQAPLPQTPSYETEPKRVQVPIEVQTVRGEPGEKGDRGEKGERGERGERGLDGIDAEPWEPTREDLARIAAMVNIEIGEEELRKIATAVVQSIPATPITAKDRDGKTIDLGELRIGQPFQIPALPGWETSFSLDDIDDKMLASLVDRLPPVTLQPGFEDKDGGIVAYKQAKPIVVKLGGTAVLPPNKVTVRGPTGTTKTQAPVGGIVALQFGGNLEE